MAKLADYSEAFDSVAFETAEKATWCMLFHGVPHMNCLLPDPQETIHPNWRLDHYAY